MVKISFECVAVINACHLIAFYPPWPADVHQFALEHREMMIMACCVVQILFITNLLK